MWQDSVVLRWWDLETRVGGYDRITALISGQIPSWMLPRMNRLQ